MTLHNHFFYIGCLNKSLIDCLSYLPLHIPNGKMMIGLVNYIWVYKKHVNCNMTIGCLFLSKIPTRKELISTTKTTFSLSFTWILFFPVFRSGGNSQCWKDSVIYFNTNFSNSGSLISIENRWISWYMVNHLHYITYVVFN